MPQPGNEFYSILLYSILFYSILFYSILFYSILLSILFYSILFYSILFYSILFYSNLIQCTPRIVMNIAPLSQGIMSSPLQLIGSLLLPLRHSKYSFLVPADSINSFDLSLRYKPVSCPFLERNLWFSSCPKNVFPKRIRSSYNWSSLPDSNYSCRYLCYFPYSVNKYICIPVYPVFS